ncbi:anti-sigma factor [Streptomyces sp. A3M-1-3]|uniref:anti-sigma factor n=1 Tax=Streptomyces sp. A3M-1-3 TaxID=2962044 RepID=UPI0020B7FAB2|nr:anti-sigma factor [Streptomyces sp. A3M-1-3]MCP3819718.1 anti-sigma factor [Streptomyces sp. A3M-1-3]
MSGADLHTATGAYALHALPENERREFEKHLATCDACAQEVAELSAAAARLGRAMAVTPPAEFKDRVLERVAATRQEHPLLTRERPRRARRWMPRVVLAACVAAAAAFGGVAVWQHQEADSARTAVQQAEQREAAVADVLAAPDTKVLTQKLADGATVSVALSRSQDAAAFIASGMPQLPAGKVYELWFSDDGTFRPAGLLSGAAGQQLRLLDGPVGEATGVGVTVEPEGGSPQPTSPPLGWISLPA